MEAGLNESREKRRMQEGCQTEGSPSSWRAQGHRYYKYSHFLRERFGGTVHRVTVDAGFTCPNVDGTVAVGGCVYCDNRSFSPNRRLPRVPIERQISRGIDILDEFRQPDVYLAYFQAATNTYAPVEKLRRLYDAALADSRVRGLIVGTRPDCVPDEVLDLLAEYARNRFVAVEYGLQSIHDRSLAWMNRGHDAASFFDAVARTKARAPTVDVSAHVILGLPGEGPAEMLATADALAGAPVDGVKIHNLHIVADTPLAEEYAAGRIAILDRDEYLEVLVAFLERLPETMVIHRVTGDAPREYLVAPDWVRHKAEFLQLLEREMTNRATWQGQHFRSGLQ